jgi:cell cycle protein kinase DBF2
MAPEVLHGTRYDHTVDYWSLGCMLFETLVGYPPFAGSTPDDTWRNLKHWRKVLVRPVFEKGSGDEEFNLQDPAWNFITRCISERKDRLQDIEEKILQLKQKKKDLVASVLSEDAGGAKTLTRDDLDDLFKME